jgi:hypothetical protein
MHVCSSLKHLLKLIHFRTYHIILASTRLWHQLLSHGTQYEWKIINIYSTSVRFWGINLVAEIYVVYRAVLSFHITTSIMLYAFLLFTQTQWNKDIYTVRVAISGYHFNDRFQRYMKIYSPQKAVWGFIFLKEVRQWSFITLTDTYLILLTETELQQKYLL